MSKQVNPAGDPSRAEELVVLITGGNRGIDYETVKLMLKSTNPSYRVLLGSRDLSRGQQASEELSSTRVSAIQLDVTSDESVSRAVSNIQEQYGHLDILVNNAGIGSQHRGSRPLVDAMQVYTVNVFGAVRVTEAFYPFLHQTPHPQLIFVSSTTSSMRITLAPDSPLSGGGAMDYRSSKEALNVLTILYWNRLEKQKFSVFGVNQPWLGRYGFPWGGSKTRRGSCIGWREDFGCYQTKNE